MGKVLVKILVGDNINILEESPKFDEVNPQIYDSIYNYIIMLIIYSLGILLIKKLKK